jgi:uncharacterized Ntn-hydrolase superfamily protein
MTYTIIARDETTGQFGVAVQTYNLAVGAWVPWAAGGIGAVATQASTDRAYGPLGLDLMRGGKTADEALTALRAADPLADVRQVAMLDRHGNIAVHTGGRCFPHAGSYVGATYGTLANMMARDTVWSAMAAAYERADGDFAARLVAALQAGQAEGGDMRGKQTAALLIVDADLNPVPLVDLRVDHNPEPVQKLAELVTLNRAYTMEYTISAHVQAGEIERAREKLDFIRDEAPGEHYLQYLRALHLAGELDEWDEAVRSLRALFAEAPVWREYLEREAAVNNFGVPGLGARLIAALDED